MDHKAWFATVPVNRRIELTEKSDGPGLLRLLVHWGMICIIASLIQIGVPFWPLLLILQGTLLVCLFHLAHEATHGTPFKTSILNRLAGHSAGFVLVLPFRWFTAFHLAHHKWTNIPGKDPELASEKPRSLPEWIWHISGIPTWLGAFGVLLRLCVGKESPTFLPERLRSRAQSEARLMLMGYLVCLSLIPIWPVIFWGWILPVLIGQPLLRLYLLAEHGGLPFVNNMFDNTRTTYTNRIVRWVTWNMPFHTEHHVWPNVPFHKLPELHQDMRAALGHTASSYTAFNKDYLKRILKV